LGKVAHTLSGPGSDRLALAALLICVTTGCADAAAVNSTAPMIIAERVFMCLCFLVADILLETRVQSIIADYF
jgi:hypothetical protein